MGKNKQHHILVVRLSAMGDVAITVPVLLAVVKAYPDLRLTVLTKAFFRPIFAQIPNIQILEIDTKKEHKGVYGLWKLYLQLKPLKINAVADLHNVLRSNILKFFFWFSGTPFIQINKGRKEKKALVASNNKTFKQLKTSHERYADVFKKLHFPINLGPQDILEKEELTTRIKDFSCPKSHRWIGVAPFAAFKGKTYPLDLMEELLNDLDNIEMYQIMLFGGGAKEEQQLNLWESKFKNCISVAGKVSFEEELTLISNLNIMVAMDSGNAHLAANYGIPVVTLWGVTHPYAGFAPYGQPKENMLLSDREKYPLIPTSIYGNKFPVGYENVMKTISPQTVVQKILEAL